MYRRYIIMSYYYNYYIGYMLEGKLYPLGPYDCFGKLQEAVSVSKSFASDLYYDFYEVKEEMISEELRKEFEYEDWQGKKVIDVKYLMMNKLPKGSFIKTGYFLIDDVKTYESEGRRETYDLFYDRVSPVVYAEMLKNEQIFGKPLPETDFEGNEIECRSASDYMYYAYPDYNSKEYEVFMIREMAEILDPFFKLPKGYELVVLETEG